MPHCLSGSTVKQWQCPRLARMWRNSITYTGERVWSERKAVWRSLEIK